MKLANCPLQIPVALLLLVLAGRSYCLGPRPETCDVTLRVWLEEDGKRIDLMDCKKHGGIWAGKGVEIVPKKNPEDAKHYAIPETGWVRLRLRAPGSYTARKIPVMESPYEGEVTLELAKDDREVTADLVLRRVELTTIKGFLVGESGEPIRPAIIWVRRNGQKTTLPRAEVAVDGSFSLRCFPAHGDTLYAWSDRIPGNEATLELKPEVTEEQPLRWVVKAKELSAVIDISIDVRGEVKPFTLELAKELYGNVVRRDLIVNRDRQEAMDDDKAFLYGYRKGVEYQLCGVRLITHAKENGFGGVLLSVVAGDEYAGIDTDDTLPVHFKVILGEKKLFECSGTVVDSDGNPLADAWIMFTPEDILYQGQPKGGGRFKSDELGRFETELIEGEHDVYVWRDGYDALKCRVQAGPESKYEFRLERKIGFSGIVVDEDGKSLSDAFFSILRANNSRSFETDNDGAFSTGEDFSARDRYHFSVAKPGLAGTFMEWNPGDKTELIITLRKGSLVKGRIQGIDTSDEKTMFYLGFSPVGLPYYVVDGCRVGNDTSYETRLHPGKYHVALQTVEIAEHARILIVRLGEIAIDDDVSNLDFSIDMDKAMSREEYDRVMRSLTPDTSSN